MLSNNYRQLHFIWPAIVIFCSSFTAGCSGLYPIPLPATQAPTLDPSPTQPEEETPTATVEPTVPQTTETETQSPELDTTPTQLTETQTSTLPPTATKPAETQTADVGASPTFPAETQTPTLEPTPTIPTATQTPGPIVQFPAQSDWVDYGIILEAGAFGEWDYYLWGGFAFSVIKKDGTYYLYYQGASDYRTDFDETVLWRAIGVATSQDGIHFSKFNGNPILTWFPNQNGEEGAVSSGVTIGEQGETVLFYGANTEESRTTVNADVRVAFSPDGLNFTDQGVVLKHDDGSVWGSGDELFSVNALYDQGQWIVYYIPNGTSESRMLGVAVGSSYNVLNQSSPVTSANTPVSAWGSVGHIRLDTNNYALILKNIREKRTEVRLGSFQSPNVLSVPVVVYQFDEVQHALLLLDRENETWFMYYQTFDNSYGVKLAPAGNNPLPAFPTP